MVLVPSAAQAAADYRVDGKVWTEGEISLVDGSAELTERGTSFPGAEIAVGEIETWQTTGPHIARGQFSYRIAELGTPTSYTVRGDAWYGDRSITPGGVGYDHVCNIYQDDADGNPVIVDDPANDSPYACVSAPEFSVHGYFADFKVVPQIGSTVRGVVQTSSVKKHQLSLAGGTYESSNDHLVVNGSLHAGDDAPLSLSAGATDTFAAYLRPTEGNENERMARGDFYYQIIEDGKPTQFWVTGYAQNIRGSKFEHESSCEIYQGKPVVTEADELAGVILGDKVEFSPYTCAMAGENLSGNGDWQVTFTVGMLDYQVLAGRQAAQYLQEACNVEGGLCLYNAAAPGDYVPYGPRILIGSAQGPTTFRGTYVDTRTVTNEVDIAIGEETTLNLAVAKVKTSLELTYGWKETVASEKGYSWTTPVAEGKILHAYLTGTYQEVSGDYFFQRGGLNYRVLKATFHFPDRSNAGTFVPEFTDVVKPPGGGVGAVLPTKPPGTTAPLGEVKTPATDLKTPLGDVKAAGSQAQAEALAVTGSSSILTSGAMLLGGSGLVAGLVLMIAVSRRDGARRR